MVTFNEILVPTDFSDHSLRALDYGVDFARKFSSRLTLVCVVEPLLQAVDMSWTSVDFDKLDKSHRKAAAARTAEIVAERVPSDIPCDVVTLVGKPFLEIIKYAKEHNIDLIVMATHGRGAMAHILMGSTAEKVVRKAPCPVLTVKHPKYIFSMPY